MMTFLKKLLWDESAFERWGRAAIVAFAMYAKSQNWLPDEIIALLVGGGLLIPAGEKNQKG